MRAIKLRNFGEISMQLTAIKCKLSDNLMLNSLRGQSLPKSCIRIDTIELGDRVS